MNKLQILRNEFIKWFRIRNECENLETIKNITDCKIDPLANKIIDEYLKIKKQEEIDELSVRFSRDATPAEQVIERISRRAKANKRSKRGPSAYTIGKFRI